MSGSNLIKNSLWMLLGFVVRLGIQVIYFILVARSLGPEEYGSFASVLALVTVVAPFASWGSGNIMIKHVSRDSRQFPKYFGASVAITFISGALLTILVVIVVGGLFSWERALTLALPIAVGDFFGTRLADVAGQAFQAHHKLSRTSSIWVLMSLYRLASAIGLFALPLSKTAILWADFYALSGLAAGISAVLWVRKTLGRGPLSLKPMRGEWREGFYFAVSLGSQGAYNDLDKTLVARFVGDAVAGTYAAAYRIFDAGFSPVRAILFASYPRFFQEGSKSLAHSRTFAFRLLPLSLGVGLVVLLTILVMGSYAPAVLGERYALVPHMLLLMSPILILRILHYFIADALTGAGYQGHRTGAQLIVAVLNLALNLWLTPRYGWQGAVYAGIVSNGLLILLLWVLVWHMEREVKKSEAFDQGSRVCFSRLHVFTPHGRGITSMEGNDWGDSGSSRRGSSE